MRKAQTQAVTLVLISGIVIALVAVAYMWGKPLIDKRSTVIQFTSAIRFVEDLDKRIVRMAGTCTGQCEESLNLPVPGLIILDEENNSMLYEFQVNQPLITKDEIPINTGNLGDVARYGDTPGVITLKGEETSANVYTLKFRIRYRELDDENLLRGYKIKLSGSGRKTGNTRVVIRYAGSELKGGEAHNNGDLVLSKIEMQTV